MLRGKEATATPMGSWVTRATHVVGPSEQEMPAWVVSDFCSPPSALPGQGLRGPPGREPWRGQTPRKVSTKIREAERSRRHSGISRH